MTNALPILKLTEVQETEPPLDCCPVVVGVGTYGNIILDPNDTFARYSTNRAKVNELLVKLDGIAMAKAEKASGR